ncbi:Plastid division protein [Actinidia chinensis var. chinensis]|uniref:Plastid division protein n=1 Tax=Actinidia chinensis var. chinensis TaxID=1590841 RepID=A0A2R6RQR0_ACTCC|nr:Plastid division protein [Actinidia chinensis var. chinensis]
MKWEMEIEDIESVQEKIWDLHDKLSDAIHSISRSLYLDSINSLRESAKKKASNNNNNNNNNDSIDDGNNNRRTGFVFVKDDDDSAVKEAKSLNAVRTALENLDDQLEFFQTVQMQQRAERDAAIACLEQSRIILAMRLAKHQGKKYGIIEEALAFVGDVHDANLFVSHNNRYGSAPCPSGENFVAHEGKRRSSNFIKVLTRGFDSAKKSLKLNGIGGILGNAALVAISMLALLHLRQVASNDNYFLELPQKEEGRNIHKDSQLEGSLSSVHLTHLDVTSARG